MIRKQLELDIGENWRRSFARLRDHERLVGDFVGRGLPIGDGDDRRATGLNFLDVAKRLLGALVVTDDDREHRRLGGDERERPVFQPARWAPLGGFVADLLAFERAFEGDRDVSPPSDEKVGVAISVVVNE